MSSKSKLKLHRDRDNTLCCCEYLNKSGERSHILQCCCDCEAVDELCDRLIRCQPVPKENCTRVLTIVEDRLRIPWCSKDGAIPVRMDVLIPIIIIPLTLAWATIDEYHTVYALACLPVFLLIFYRMWLRNTKKTRTKLFFSWALTSVFLMVALFDCVVVKATEIPLTSIIFLHIMFLGMLISLYCVKKDSGIITKEKSDRYCTLRNQLTNPEEIIKEEESPLLNALVNNFGFNRDELIEKEKKKGQVIYEEDVIWIDSRPFQNGKLVQWCDLCDVYKLPRSGHCNVCNVCVLSRDHHCVWIDQCIGEENHRSFIVAMLLFILTGFYGSHLTLDATCTYTTWLDLLPLPSSCEDAYGEFMICMCFVGALYSVLFTTVMCVVLLEQCLLIGQNVTGQELYMASVRGHTKYIFFATRNHNNHGLLRNWIDFWRKSRNRLKNNACLSVI